MQDFHLKKNLKTFWRPGFAQTRCGRLCAPAGPLAVKREEKGREGEGGGRWNGKGGDRMGRTREEGKGREREKGAFWLSFSYEATTDCKHTHTHTHTTLCQWGPSRAGTIIVHTSVSSRYS